MVLVIKCEKKLRRPIDGEIIRCSLHRDILPNIQLQTPFHHLPTSKMPSDLDRQIELLRNCELITEAEVKDLCNKAKEILVEESNVQLIDAPVTVREKI